MLAAICQFVFSNQLAATGWLPQVVGAPFAEFAADFQLVHMQPLLSLCRSSIAPPELKDFLCKIQAPQLELSVYC